MELKRNAPYVLGVDLGGTNVRAAVTDRGGQKLGTGRAPSRAAEGVETTVAQIVSAIRGALETASVGTEAVAGLGIGVPGVIEPQTGMVLWAPNFFHNGEQYRNIDLGTPLAAHLGLPVLLGNDANVAAIGEYRFGAGQASPGGRPVRSLVMLTLGTGVGGGVILDGKLWTGATGGAGELGHIIVAANARGGETMFGSLEGMAQISAICERAARKICLGRPSLLAERLDYDWHRITPKDIAEAAADGDEVARETLEETGYYVGIGIASVINLLNPEMVVVGGGVALAGDLIFEPIRRTVRANAIPSLMAACSIVPAQLEDDAGILGGVSLVLDALEDADREHGGEAQ